MEMVRYGFNGGFLMVFNVAIMAMFVEFGLLRVEFAAIVSTTVVICFGFVIMQYWVFPDSSNGRIRKGIGYWLTIMVGKLLNYIVFLGLLAISVPYPAAWIIGAATVFFGTYSVNRWIWYGKVSVS